MRGFLASLNELVGMGLVQLTVTSDELSPQRQLSNLASRVSLNRSCQEAGWEQRPIARKVVEPRTATEPIGTRCNPAGIFHGIGQFRTTNCTSAGTQGARPLAVREMQPDLAALVFDLVPEASVLCRTQCRSEGKP